jgi:GxxExxY protein
MGTDAINNTSFLIIQSAIEIHREIGPGLLESAYRTCMIYELRQRGLAVAAEQVIPVRYKHLMLEGTYRIDLLVQDAIIVELRSVEVVLPVHHAQVLSYLRLTGKQLGLLINFNVRRLVDGVDRIANKFATLRLSGSASPKLQVLPRQPQTNSS